MGTRLSKSASWPYTKLQQAGFRGREIAFLLAAAGVAVILFLTATSAYGMGVMSDSMHYISAADHLARGEGVIDYIGAPLVDWPPGYPFVLGAIRRASGIKPLVAGRFLNAAAMAGIIFCAGVIFKRCFPERPAWFYLGVSFTLLSFPMHRVGAAIGTDLLFYLTMLCFFLIAQDYLAQPKFARLLALGLLCAWAALLRYVGGVLVAVGLVVIVVALKEKGRRFWHCLVFSAISLLPILTWVVFRNYRLYQTLTGPRDPANFIVGKNLIITMQHVTQWFLPVRVTQPVPAGFWPLALLLVLLLLNRRDDWLRWLRRLASPPNLPLSAFLVFYIVAITFTIPTVEHDYLYDDRYQFPLYFPVILGLFITLDELVLPHIKRSPKYAEWGMIILLGAWCLYPSFLIYKFLVKSLDNGVAGYNEFNTRVLNEAALVRGMRGYPYEEGVRIFTNYPALFYFYTERDTSPSPVDRKNNRPSREYLLENYAGWPGDSPAYLIYFLRDDRRQYFTPKMLGNLAKIEPILEDETGGIYRVISK